jgi:hypothetical protein
MSWLFVAFLKSIAPFIQWGLAVLAVFIAWKNGGLNSVFFVIGLIVVAALGGLQLATGLLLWAIVQVLILQWILFGFDRVAMRGTLIEMQQFSGQQTRGRGRAERDIFKKLSQTPTAWLKWSGILGIAAVAVDLWVNVVAYPPVKDGKIESFMSAISLGRWAQIDWAAIFQILISMTMFEAAIIFIVVVKQWIDKRELGKTA